MGSLVRGMAWLGWLLATTMPWLLSAEIPAFPVLLGPTGRTVLMIAGLALFIPLATEKRTILFAYFVTLVTYTLKTGKIPGNQLAPYIALVIFAAIVYEAVHQNIPLYRQLRAKGIDVPRIMWGSARLWSPMLIFIAIGFGLNFALSTGMTNAAYKSLPIDRYCHASSAKNSHVLPCSEISGSLDSTTFIENRELLQALIHAHFVRSRMEAMKLIDTQKITLPGDIRDLAVRLNDLIVPPVNGWPIDPSLPGPVAPASKPTVESLISARARRDFELNRLLESLKTARDKGDRNAALVLVKKLDARQLELVQGVREDLRKDRALLIRELQSWLSTRIAALPRKFNVQRPLVDPSDSTAVESALSKIRKEFLQASDRLEANVQTYLGQFLSPDSIYTGTGSSGGLFGGDASSLTPPVFTFIFKEAYNTTNVLAEVENIIAKIGDERDFKFTFPKPPAQLIREIATKRGGEFATLLGVAPQCSTRRQGDVTTRAKFTEAKAKGEDFDGTNGEYLNEEWFDCPEANEYPLELTPLSFSASVGRSLAFKARNDPLRADTELAEMMRRPSEVGDVTKTGAKTIDTIKGQIDLGRETCRMGWMPPSHCIANYIKERAENGYHSAVTRWQTKARLAPDRRVEKAEHSAIDKIVASRAAIYRSSALIQAEIEASMHRWLSYQSIVSSVLALVFSLAVLKSYLYVLATEIFHRDSVGIMALLHEEAPMGHYETPADAIRIAPPSHPSQEQKLITKTHGTNQDREVVLVPPYSTTSIVTRIWHRAYFGLIRGGHYKPQQGASQHDMIFSSGTADRFVKWEMVDGEVVVFSYRDFLGISDNVKLGTKVSLQLATLLLGRYIFHTATCGKGRPGLLLLKTRGQLVSNEIACETLDRIVAWNAQTKFRVVGRRTSRGVFIDGYQLTPHADEQGPTGLVVAKATSSEGRFAWLVRFARTFLAPF